MASKSALQIGLKIEEFLGRSLTAPERLKCEEMILNYYPTAIMRYVEGLITKKSPKQFAIIYYPIMNGLLRGAQRRMDLIQVKSRFKDVFQRAERFVGDGMPDSDLEALLFLADDCTDPEIEAAFGVARLKGIMSIAYVKALIIGNRRDAMLKSSNRKEFKQILPSKWELKKHAKGQVPQIDRIQELWRGRLKYARDTIKLGELELNARKRLFREHAESNDTGTKE